MSTSHAVVTCTAVIMEWLLLLGSRSVHAGTELCGSKKTKLLTGETRFELHRRHQRVLRDLPQFSQPRLASILMLFCSLFGIIALVRSH